MCLSYCFVGVWCWQSREWTNKCLFLPIIGVGSVSVYGGDLHDHGARWLMLQHSTCIMIGSIHTARVPYTTSVTTPPVHYATHSHTGQIQNVRKTLNFKELQVFFVDFLLNIVHMMQISHLSILYQGLLYPTAVLYRVNNRKGFSDAIAG